VLTETAIKHAKPKGRPYKMGDSKGLTLLVQPDGARYWRFRYRLWGLEKGLSLGVYPDVPLAKARDRRDAARKLVADGVDPSDIRQQERNALKDTFSVLAKDWAGRQDWAPITRTKNERVIKYLNAEVGSRPASKITTAIALDALKKIAQRGPDVGQVEADWPNLLVNALI
jgi:hypothetical protein